MKTSISIICSVISKTPILSKFSLFYCAGQVIITKTKIADETLIKTNKICEAMPKQHN